MQTLVSARSDYPYTGGLVWLATGSEGPGWYTSYDATQPTRYVDTMPDPLVTAARLAFPAARNVSRIGSSNQVSVDGEIFQQVGGSFVNASAMLAASAVGAAAGLTAPGYVPGSTVRLSDAEAVDLARRVDVGSVVMIEPTNPMPPEGLSISFQPTQPSDVTAAGVSGGMAPTPGPLPARNPTDVTNAQATAGVAPGPKSNYWIPALIVGGILFVLAFRG